VSASPNAHLLVGEMPATCQLNSHWCGSTGLSIVGHILGLAALLYTATHASQVAQMATASAATRQLIFLPEKGQEHGGGGRLIDPQSPRRAEIIAAMRENATSAIANQAEVPIPDVIVAMQTPQAAQTLPGTLSPLDAPGGGATDAGNGTGMDGGRGDGAGPGEGGNHGGGPHQIGNGVSSPVLIHEIRPNYTGDAMRAKLQGPVEMEAVVQPDGTVDPKSIRVTRSLDSTFGLDDQAIIAVKQWRFRPATLHGQAVAVIINIELTFTLR
jgi:periplasmic protein TonB